MSSLCLTDSNSKSYNGPDCIPNIILKHFSYKLAAPICAIGNSSFRQGILPDQWKISRITPLSKLFPVKTVENDTRLIAITNFIVKIAESLIGGFFSDHFAPLLDTNQFGCTARRSTTHALIKLTYEWFKASDNSNNLIRIFFLDFSKAFDFINHNVLLQKFLDYNFPLHITVWSLLFYKIEKSLTFASIGNINSTILKFNAGTHQGTIAGPNDFKLLLKDLQFDYNYAK